MTPDDARREAWEWSQADCPQCACNDPVCEFCDGYGTVTHAMVAHHAQWSQDRDEAPWCEGIHSGQYVPCGGPDQRYWTTRVGARVTVTTRLNDDGVYETTASYGGVVVTPAAFWAHTDEGALAHHCWLLGEMARVDARRRAA